MSFKDYEKLVQNFIKFVLDNPELIPFALAKNKKGVKYILDKMGINKLPQNGYDILINAIEKYIPKHLKEHPEIIGKHLLLPVIETLVDFIVLSHEIMPTLKEALWVNLSAAITQPEKAAHNINSIAKLLDSFNGFSRKMVEVIDVLNEQGYEESYIKDWLEVILGDETN